MNDSFCAVCGVLEIDGKVLLVRHTYGVAAGRILCPGGYVKEKELPHLAVEREIWEETGVTARTRSLIAVQFKVHQWCPVFVLDYVSGIPVSDGHENSEVLLLDLEEAIGREDITNMSREILKIYRERKDLALPKNHYQAKNTQEQDYALFG